MDGQLGSKIAAEARRNDSLSRNRRRRRKMTTCNFQGQTLVKLDLYPCREENPVSYRARRVQLHECKAASASERRKYTFKLQPWQPTEQEQAGGREGG